MCGREVSIQVDKSRYDSWIAGELVQVAFPYLSPGSREFLISGLCEDCQESIFSDDEDESF